MNRPTKELVHMLLAEYAERDCPCTEHDTPRVDAHNLADEVRALVRAEAAAINESADLASEVMRLQESIDLYRATIARVEAQLEKWRDRDNDWRQPHVGSCETEHGMDLAESRCIDELEAALKGGNDG